MKSKKLQILKIAISVVILVMLAMNMQFDELKQINVSFSFTTIALVIFVLFISMFTRSYRWRYLMNIGQKDIKISQADSFKFLLVGTSLNIIMPAGAGDVAKSYFGYKWTGIKERMLSVSLYDKLISIASLAILAVYSIYITHNYLFIFAILLSILPIALLLLYHKSNYTGLFGKLINFLQKKSKRLDLKEVMAHMKFPTSTAINAVIISIVGWIFTYILLWYCFDAVHFDTSLTYIIAISPILTLGRLFPFTLNGLGSDEALIVMLFANGSAHKEQILVAALLYRLISLILPALWGLYYLVFSKNNTFTSKQEA